MSPEFLKSLTHQLKVHEGVKKFPYTDTVGKLTIGVGRNLDDRGLSDSEVDHLLQNDLRLAAFELDAAVPDWWRLTNNRRAVLVDMVFNLGRPRLLTFKNFLAALKACDYHKAAAEMLDSKWAQQVGQRAKVLAYMMKHDAPFETARGKA